MKKINIKGLTFALTVCIITSGVFGITKITSAKKNISLNKTTATVQTGKKLQLKVIGTNKNVKWTSSNAKIATVNNNGKVLAKKKGTCKIIARVDSKKLVCSIKVKNIADSKTNTSENTVEETARYEVVSEELTIKAGEKSIYGNIYKPKAEGKFPTVIMSHGYNGIGKDFTTECNYLAKNGYIAYAFDFCGGSTRSKSSGKSTDMTVFTEKSDLIDVFNYIKTLEQVDTEQIFLFGGSQGGFVTTLATEELSTQIKGMILYFPALNIPDDWRKTYPDANQIPDTKDFWGLKLGGEFFRSIHDFYTFDNIGSYPNDVLIIYGDKDNIVPYSAMTKAKETYKNAELVVLPGEGHGFSPAGTKKSCGLILEFLDKHNTIYLDK